MDKSKFSLFEFRQLDSLKYKDVSYAGPGTTLWEQQVYVKYNIQVMKAD